MAKKKSSGPIGENPLDLVIPRRSGGSAKKSGAKSKKPPAASAAKPKTEATPEAPKSRAKKPPGTPKVTPKPKEGRSKSTPASTPNDAVTELDLASQPIGRAAAGQYVTFFLAGEEYAASVLNVKEILEYETLTRVPTTPPWIMGVMNLRGSVVPVVDLNVRFGLSEGEITERTCIIIVEVASEGETTDMGILADAVNQVVHFTDEEIEAAPTFGTRIRVDYLKGMGKAGEKFVLILDVDRILMARELMTVVAVRDAAQHMVAGGSKKSSKDSSKESGSASPAAD